MATIPDPISPAEPIQVLNYSPPSTSSTPRGVRIFFVIALLPVVVVPFIPFTYGTPPADVLYELARDPFIGWPPDLNIAMLAPPFFLGILIWLLHVRLLLAGRMTVLEKIIAIILGISCMAMTLTFVGIAFFQQAGSFNSFSLEDWIILSISPGIICVSFFAMFWLARGQRSEIVAKGWLYTAYLANAGMCLAAFRMDRDPGWYLTAVASFVMILEIIQMRLVVSKRHPA